MAESLLASMTRSLLRRIRRDTAQGNWLQMGKWLQMGDRLQTAISGRSPHVERLEPRLVLSLWAVGQDIPLEPSHAGELDGATQEFGASSGWTASSHSIADLIHWWKLDETTGLTAVDSIGDADGTLMNMTGNEWTDGFHDGGLAFDGANDYITVGTVPSLQLSSQMTIAAWVKPEDFPNWGGIAGWLHDTGSIESGYSLNTMGGGGLSFGLKTVNGGMTYLTAGGYEPGQWHHVTGTYDGSVQRLYIDGAQMAEESKTGAIDWNPLSPDGFEIGRYHDDNENIMLPETIDDVRVYDRALTAEEVSQLTDMTPVGQWDFDDPNDLTVATIGKDLVLSGTDTAVAGFKSSDGAAQIGVGSYYAMEHGIDPNGGGSYVNQFTLVFDVLAPAVNRWIALYQTNPTNSNDGDAFVHTSSNTIGVGDTGYSSEAIVANQWYRIVFAVDNENRYDIYLNGEQILDGTVQSIDGRFSLDPTLLAFADNNGEDNTINVSRLAIYDWALSDAQAKFLGGIGATELAFRTNPYLQNVDTDGIVVMWEMSDDVPISVEYGLDASYGANVAATSIASGTLGTFIYKAEITGLTEETTYHYRLFDDADPQPLTEDRQFTTFTTSEIDFSFAMWSDSQGTNHDTWTADPYAPTTAMFDHMVARGVDFGFTTGDLAENGSSYSDTHVYYLDRVAEHLGQSVPWFNAWGNHDGSSSSIIRKFADMPSKDRGAPYTSGYGSFAFEQAGVLFIAIDYFSMGDITSGWLEGVLQSHPDPRFTVLGIHVPPYCERWIDGSSSLRTNLVPLAEQYDIDLIVSGHTHEYERGELNGVNYLITGGGSWLDIGEPIVREWDHMTVGGAHDLPGEVRVESSTGVLGPPQPIEGGLVNQYTELRVEENRLEVYLHAFNADGSYIGILDTHTITHPLEADFDSDSDVDGTDFLAWQRGFGIEAPHATLPDGDANGDQAVDGDDLTIWQGEFGQTVASSNLAELAMPPAMAMELSVSSSQSSTAGVDATFSNDAITGKTISERLLTQQALWAFANGAAPKRQPDVDLGNLQSVLPMVDRAFDPVEPAVDSLPRIRSRWRGSILSAAEELTAQHGARSESVDFELLDTLFAQF